MEQNFQTSFIPKKPVLDETPAFSKPSNLPTVIAVVIFFVVMGLIGALYFYNLYLGRSIASMRNNLDLAKGRFEPEKIVQLQTLDKRIKSSNDILSNHITVSPIFEALQKITMKNVAFTRFDYSIQDEKGAMVKVDMDGIAQGYKAIALQADLFSKNKNFIDPVFSGLSLDDTGSVLFKLSFSVDPNFVNYKKVLEATGVDAASPPANNLSNPPTL